LRPGTEQPAPKLGYALSYDPWKWVVGTGVYNGDIDAVFWVRAREAAIWTLGAVLLGIAAVIVIGRSILRPLRALTSGMGELASGNFSVVLPGLGRRDEIGGMAQAVENFKIRLAEKARFDAEEKAEAEQRAALVKREAQEHELAQQKAAEERSAAEHKAALCTLADQFESAVGQVVETVSSSSAQLETAAETLAQTTETTQRLSYSVATASDQASGNVQSVASATEEMTISVQEIGRQVHESNRIANEAVRQANMTDARISELTQAAGRIGDVIKLITAIAEQTNLLALNATIEAARAGEAGKGFAVVAQEVKALAAQTARATDEIGTQIAGMQTATTESVKAIKEIGATISRMSEISESVAAAVKEQGEATHNTKSRRA
jgi:methyl-accepting chemotaxis protein